MAKRYNPLNKKGKNQKILIHGANYVITIDKHDELSISEDTSILIEGKKIKKIFPKKDFEKYVDFDKVDLIYDAEQKGGVVVTPGLINMHDHPPMYLLRSALSFAEDDHDKSLKLMAEMEGKMNQDEQYLSTLGDLTEQQKSGITTTLSHYAVFDPIEKAAEESGHQVINCVSAASNSHPDNTPKLVEKYLKRKTSNTKAGIALHYVWKAKPPVLTKISGLMKKYDVFFTLHVAETEKTIDACVERYGKRPVYVLEDYGLLGPKTIMSHCVHLEQEEIKLIKKRKAVVVHLPTSNLLHRSGQFDYREFVNNKATKQISLGTDSVVSKNRLDILTEALTTKTLHQAREVISYKELFDMCTARPAKLLGLKKTGKVLPGYTANLAFWKLKDRGLTPYDEEHPETLVSNLITHGSRMVRDLMIAGRFVISNRHHNLVDESELLEKLQKAHMNIRKREKAAGSTAGSTAGS